MSPSIRSARANGAASTVRTFNVRSSGRDLSAVRRPVRANVQTEAPDPEPTATPLPKTSTAKPAKSAGTVKVKGNG